MQYFMSFMNNLHFYLKINEVLFVYLAYIITIYKIVNKFIVKDIPGLAYSIVLQTGFKRHKLYQRPLLFLKLTNFYIKKNQKSKKIHTI